MCLCCRDCSAPVLSLGTGWVDVGLHGGVAITMNSGESVQIDLYIRLKMMHLTNMTLDHE